MDEFKLYFENVCRKCLVTKDVCDRSKKCVNFCIESALQDNPGMTIKEQIEKELI